MLIFGRNSLILFKTIFSLLMYKRFQKILLVDDDAVANFLSESALQEMNLSEQVHISHNGEEALNYIIEHCSKDTSNTGNCPDLIFLDINMPVMDGFQFLEEFEKIPTFYKKPVKIVMLTSSSANADIEKARKFNVEGYIVKPLCPEKIEALFK